MPFLQPNPWPSVLTCGLRKDHPIPWCSRPLYQTVHVANSRCLLLSNFLIGFPTSCVFIFYNLESFYFETGSKLASNSLMWSQMTLNCWCSRLQLLDPGSRYANAWDVNTSAQCVEAQCALSSVSVNWCQRSMATGWKDGWVDGWALGSKLLIELRVVLWLIKWQRFRSTTLSGKQGRGAIGTNI